jgi:hypothetical protein
MVALAYVTANPCLIDPSHCRDQASVIYMLDEGSAVAQQRIQCCLVPGGVGISVSGERGGCDGFVSIVLNIISLCKTILYTRYSFQRNWVSPCSCP